MATINLSMLVTVSFDTLDDVSKEDLEVIKTDMVDRCKFQIYSTLNDVLEELEIENETPSPVQIEEESIEIN